MSKTMPINFADHAMALKQLSERYQIDWDSMVSEAMSVLVWAICEKMDGRRICSVEAATIIDECLITEFVEERCMYESPLLSKLSEHIYREPPL